MSRISPRLAGLGVLATVLAVATLLTQMDLRLVSSQAVTLKVKQTDAQVPLDDPLAPIWQTAEPVEVPLSAQQTTVPMGGGSIRSVTARALHDRERIFFRVEWDDPTQDMSAFAHEDYRDAAAIQFPAKGVSTTPFFCMGQGGGEVNIWHWKADWQADIDTGFVSVPQTYPNSAVDFYPFEEDEVFNPGRAVGNPLSQPDRTTPVENLVARGFGTLTSADAQTVSGKGIWQDGKWYVLFAREMQTTSDTYTPFSPGQTTNVAFAVWDGNAEERDGLKSVSQFADLEVEGAPEGPPPTGVVEGHDNTEIVLLVVFILVVLVAALLVFMVRQRARGM